MTARDVFLGIPVVLTGLVAGFIARGFLVPLEKREPRFHGPAAFDLSAPERLVALLSAAAAYAAGGCPALEYEARMRGALALSGALSFGCCAQCHCSPPGYTGALRNIDRSWRA